MTLMKNISAIIVSAVMLVACSTDEIDVFDSHNYLSFSSESLSYTFAFDDEETKSADFNIPVVYAGRYNDQDVTFSIVAVPEKSTAVEGTHYQMPAAQDMIIKANENTGNLVLKLLRTEDMKEGNDTLVLAVKANDNFLPGPVDTMKVVITDRIIKPDWWTYTVYDRYLGSYTEMKLKLFLEFMGVTDGSDPFDTDEYVQWLDYGTGNYIYKSFKDWEVKPKVMEFRQWLLTEKGNPVDTDGKPIAETLGNF